ncbi:mitochondrial import receptor subunit TOM40-1-like protein [Tanacetum coccineum]|uniref:Mitochondrial import receptor subunit TOM40-1-like protein n=1 Tax=Tanacetum coccineum TaxID=301880 RepID=A0ABQ5IH91_9ASTR
MTYPCHWFSEQVGLAGTVGVQVNVVQCSDMVYVCVVELWDGTRMTISLLAVYSMHVGIYFSSRLRLTRQIPSTGMVALGYVYKVSEKVSLASNLMYHYMSAEATASFCCDYLLRQIWKNYSHRAVWDLLNESARVRAV